MLPELTPLLVVDDADVEELMRTARADLAKLSLELRALQREATAAREALPADDDEPSLDLVSAQELLRTGVEARLARRRVERRAEIERAEHEAARRIADAEAEASALVDAARAELLRALAGRSSMPRSVQGLAPRTPRPQPVEPEDEFPAASRWEPLAADDADWRSMTEVVPSVAAPSAAPPAPPPPPAPPAVPQVPVTLAVVEDDRPQLRVKAPVPQAGRPSGARRQHRWQGLLHIDVLLPLIAVLIVVVLLLAWLS